MRKVTIGIFPPRMFHTGRKAYSNLTHLPTYHVTPFTCVPSHAYPLDRQLSPTWGGGGVAPHKKVKAPCRSTGFPPPTPPPSPTHNEPCIHPPRSHLHPRGPHVPSTCTHVPYTRPMAGFTSPSVNTSPMAHNSSHRRHRCSCCDTNSPRTKLTTTPRA